MSGSLQFRSHYSVLRILHPSLFHCHSALAILHPKYPIHSSSLLLERERFLPSPGFRPTPAANDREKRRWQRCRVCTNRLVTLVIVAHRALAHAGRLGVQRGLTSRRVAHSLYATVRPRRLRMGQSLSVDEGRTNCPCISDAPHIFSFDRTAIGRAAPVRMSLRKRHAYGDRGGPWWNVVVRWEIKGFRRVAEKAGTAGWIRLVSEWIHPVFHRIQGIWNPGWISAGPVSRLRVEERTGGRFDARAV
jgi:hypothetical protein